MSGMWQSYKDKQLGVEDYPPVPDPVNHPDHYKSHPSGIEAIQITEHENFCIGSVYKYLLRTQRKGIARLEKKHAGFWTGRLKDWKGVKFNDA